MLKAAPATSKILAPCASLEMWGGATFDVALRSAPNSSVDYCWVLFMDKKSRTSGQPWVVHPRLIKAVQLQATLEVERWKLIDRLLSIAFATCHILTINSVDKASKDALAASIGEF